MKTFSDFYNIYQSTTNRSDVSEITVAHKTFVSSKLKPVKGNRLVVMLALYRDWLTPWEERNLENSLLILQQYDICVLCPSDLDMSWFEKRFNIKPIYHRMNRIYFRSKESYSKLMERASFYNDYKEWNFMLIVQPDVWMFRTSGKTIEDFMKFDKVYLGAPWSRQYAQNLGIDKELCGNGGFSLRKPKELCEVLKNTQEQHRNARLVNVEDQYISYILYKKNLNAPVTMALQFSIDNEPKMWHHRMYVDTLPLGVHMSKPEMREYWEPYIKKDIEATGDAYHCQRIIVSLTSFGERLKKDCGSTIRKFLMTLTIKPDLIVLTIYKDDIQNIPDDIRTLEKQGKVEIIIAEENLRPHLKYYYTMLKYQDDIIITIDDDNNYEKDCIAKLLQAYRRHPECVSSLRCHKILWDVKGKVLPYNNWKQETDGEFMPSHELFATGVGGVLYSPGILREYLNIERIKELITTDDIYLKELELQHDVKVFTAYDRRPPKLHYINTVSAKSKRLCDDNTRGAYINDINIKKTMIANRMSGRKVVYTCISGNYDTLRDPSYVTPGWEYICFTDLNISSKVWTVRPLPKEIVEDKSLTQVKRQRIVKIQPWRFIGACDVCVWVDANLKITGNIDELVGLIGSDYLGSITHPERKDIYQESKAIVKYRKDTMQNMQTQLDIYRKDGYPENSGLHETNVIVRRQNADVQRVMNMWEDFLRKYSHRDLMSFDYVLWKLGVKCHDISPEQRKKFVLWLSHQRNRK